MPIITPSNGLNVAASGNTLIGQVAAFEGDSGYYTDCEFTATVVSSTRASLDALPDGGVDCPVSSDYGLFGTIYPSGVLTLDGGALTADFAVTFLEVSGDSIVDAGLGTLTSQCTSLVEPTCPWLR
jgi:hypothetical protein